MSTSFLPHHGGANDIRQPPLQNKVIRVTFIAVKTRCSSRRQAKRRRLFTGIPRRSSSFCSTQEAVSGGGCQGYSSAVAPHFHASNSRITIVAEQAIEQGTSNLHNVTLSGNRTVLSGSGVWVAPASPSLATTILSSMAMDTGRLLFYALLRTSLRITDFLSVVRDAAFPDANNFPSKTYTSKVDCGIIEVF